MSTEKTILLVEDNEDDRLLTIRAFSKAGVVNTVIPVNDGVEACDYLFGTGQYAERGPTAPLPQLVLLDLNLPRVDGLEVLRRIRLDARTKLLPVVVLTSSNEEEDILRSYVAGANSYVRKPVDFTQFSEAAKNLGLFWLLLNEAPPGGTR